ncbi:MAG: 6-phosphofructokinase [Anaerolineae bacterium]|nr:6-phosphofructokinase [Anaerolineae bacterium]
MKRIGVLTSGGDAPGMNAAVRAVVRTALDKGVEVQAIYEGYQGMVEGGDRIRSLTWNDVGGILHQGGTIIGSARSAIFRQREGRLQAVKNLILHGIEGLVVIGGDGSLTGAQLLFDEWPGLVEELVTAGQVSAAATLPKLPIVGLIGSIDNDMYGTDITIGADTALHRIVDAIDAISSTAASHQRSFVVEVMGRRCGYLALMGALASGADWVLIPESPPNLDNWEDKMAEVLRLGRQVGRRDSIVVIAEGAQDRRGNPISSEYVKEVLEKRVGEDTRITVLGHVQRGGSPTAFDRILSTQLGAAAVELLLNPANHQTPYVIGMRNNRITQTPLPDCLRITQEINQAVNNLDFNKAMDLRGNSFRQTFANVRTLVRALPHAHIPGQKQLHLAILNAGSPAPGMNTAVRAAVRIALDKGHRVSGIYHGFKGLIKGDIKPLDWRSVNGWAIRGGAELGSNRHVPQGSDFYAIARNLEEQKIDGLLMVGGWDGYLGMMAMYNRRDTFPAFNLPLICLPASINNGLPGAELSVGADTALNSIIEAVDKIKQSAVASRRTFVVEVMGRYCGYLALMSALATGAERVYLHEEGVCLDDLSQDVKNLRAGFAQGKRVGLMIRNEMANPIYTTQFMSALFEEEGGDLFDVRQAILGHLQQGGNPSPFDRIQASRLANDCIQFLETQAGQAEPMGACIGLVGGEMRFTEMRDVARMMDMETARPRQQWWLDLRPIARILAQPAPNGKRE